MTHRVKKVAVVGFGYWGQKLAAASASAGLEVVIVDPLSDSKIAYERMDWTAVLADAQIDGVIIATPEKTHAALVLAALQAHKAVLVEKPATTTVKSWQDCVALAEKHSLPLLVDYTFLYSQALRQWQRLTAEYGAEFGALQQLTTTRKAAMSPERITGKALPIWWDVVIHDLYLLRAIFQDTPTDWQVQTADLPGQIKTIARFETARKVKFIADYSWLVAQPERSWLAVYEQGSLFWQRAAGGEEFVVTLRGQKVFSTVVADQNPSPLDTLIQNWLQLWQEKNLSKTQKKHWRVVENDIHLLVELSKSLTAQVATRLPNQN